MESLWELGKMHTSSLSCLDRTVLSPGIPHSLPNTALIKILTWFGHENRFLFFDEFMWRIHVKAALSVD